MNRKQGSWLETYLLVFGLAALMLLSLTGSVRAQENDDEEEPEFELVTLYLEFNATDNDAEVVTVVDAEVGLKELKKPLGNARLGQLLAFHLKQVLQDGRRRKA